jgi:HD-like signal output (HDOD) protein
MLKIIPASAQAAPTPVTKHDPNRLVAESAPLATLPMVFAKVKQIVDDPSTTARDLTPVIALDPAMTARVLKLVNSAFWGIRGRVESVSRAVALLGMLQVHDLVLASSVATIFQRVNPQLMDVGRFWRGSVLRALAAAALAKRGGLVDIGRVFTEGLLSDIGHMVLYHRLPEAAAKARTDAGTQFWRLASLESAQIGCNYAEVGGALVEAWGLPVCFADAIRHQLAPIGANDYALEASLLHIAGFLAEATLAETPAESCVPLIDTHAWETAGLDAACVAPVVGEMTANLSSTLQVFSLRAAA